MDCSGVPPNRLAALARYELASKAPILAALAEPRRTATLLAMTRHLDAVAIDDALDLFALLMATKLINPARRASAAERLASLPRLERASRTLAVVNRELSTALDAAVDGRVDVAAVWAAIERIAPRAQIAGALDLVLHRDVEVALPTVLRGQPGTPALREPGTDRRQPGRGERDRNPATEQPHGRDVHQRCRASTHRRPDGLRHRVLLGARQMVEQGDVGVEVVAVGWEVRPAQGRRASAARGRRARRRG